MATLNPYLTFNGNCREAMNFYKDVLGGELDLMKAGDTPAASQMPEKYHDQILHSTLKTEHFEIMATDMVSGGFNEGDTVQLCLICKSEEEIYLLFDKLSAGGKVKQPLSEMFFGLIGNLTDKFGKNWLLELNKPADQ
ncbi:VOC family protein [soil metagenome]